MSEENDEFEIEEESKTPNKNLSLVDKCKAYLSREEGKTYDSIAQGLGRSTSTIFNLYSKAQLTNSLDNKHSNKGRYSKGSTILTDNHKRFILKWLEAGKHKSSRELWRHLTSIKSVKWVGYDTINNYLKSLGSWVKPRLRTVISQKNLLKRKIYCEANMNIINGQDVIYTDESLFELNRVTARVFKFKRAATPEIEKLSTWTRQMVWAGVSLKGKTQIHFIEGWINNRVYVDVLRHARQDILRLFTSNFYFVQDNARPHVHKNSIRYIKRWITPNIKDHPPQSPDLNPIELVWGRLKDMVEAKRPRNKQELRQAIEECWAQIPMSFIRGCIRGLPGKMAKALEDADKKMIVEDDVGEAAEDDYDSIDDGFESEQEEIDLNDEEDHENDEN